MKIISSFVAFLTMVGSFVGYVASLGLRMGPPADRTELSMDVSGINNLEIDSNVLLRGVPIGKVTGFDTTVSSATIHFYIDSQYKIPTDSVVKLENLSALGESFIELGEIVKSCGSRVVRRPRTLGCRAMVPG
ncbi:MlaD family protein [Mycolicibacterium peregrinum]|uniref:MlaD family protein n=1 Tax=Mycolicibacterium peregrinum TaxID=43304 RepID=UPI003AABE114